jgi:putative transposase
MPHSYVSCLVHYVFSTKDRRPQLSPGVRERLFPYMAGIARGDGVTPLSIGGVEDHVHMLLSLPATMPVAKAVQTIKGTSSKWLHDTFAGLRDFAWQEGYGAFSVAISQVDETIAYVQGQEDHHRRRTFQEEFLLFLEKHGIEYDTRYVWG